MDQPSGSAGRILVVDDQTVLRRKLELAVRALGYDAVGVAGGAEALERCRGERFDLILLDILMPEMDGFEVLARLKADPRRRDIPVVVTSCDQDVGRDLEALRASFVPKPVEPDKLLEKISQVLH